MECDPSMPGEVSVCGWRLGFVSMSLNPLETCCDNCAARNPVPQRQGASVGRLSSSHQHRHSGTNLPLPCLQRALGAVQEVLTNKAKSLCQVAASLVVAYSEAAGMLDS